MAELVCSADDPRWLTERRKGITATDITTILGLNPYQSPYGLWWEKTSPDMPERADSDRLRLGRELEPLIMARWREQSNLPASSHMVGPGLWRSKERPWQLATPDAVIYPPRYDDTMDCTVELKSWADADRRSWGQGELPEPHDAEWAAERSMIPPRVRAQVLWQMDVMGVSTGHVGVLFLPSGEFRSYVIEHSPIHLTATVTPTYRPDMCPECTDVGFMRGQARDFLDRIDHGDSPDVDGSAATLAALRARFQRYPDKSVPVDDDLVFAWVEQKTKRDYHEARARELEAKIRVKLGEATFGTVNDIPVVRRFISDAKVKAHTRHQDYLKIIPARGADDE